MTVTVTMITRSFGRFNGLNLLRHPETEPHVLPRAVACGPGRRSTSVMLGHACEMLAVMYLQPGPPIAENETTTHGTHRTHRTQGHGHGRGHGIFILATHSPQVALMSSFRACKPSLNGIRKSVNRALAMLPARPWYGFCPLKFINFTRLWDDGY